MLRPCPNLLFPKQSCQLISKTPKKKKIARNQKESTTITSTLILNGMRTGVSGIEVEIEKSGESSRDFTGKGHRGLTLCAAVFSFSFFFGRGVLQYIVRGFFFVLVIFTVLPRGKIKKKFSSNQLRHVCSNFDLFAYI